MMADNPLATETGGFPVRRAEIALLAALLCLALGLRAWHLSNVGLDHFDEGAYVFSALGVTDPSQPHRFFPNQEKFSPPVFVALVGLAYAIGGPSDLAAVLVNLLVGTLTVAVIWWVGRSWFGPPAGIGAAALLATSEYHIALSRSALTDVTFALIFLVALAAVAAAVQRPNLGLAILAGLAVALAWNTKYHGWFALVAAGAATVPYAWLRRRAVSPPRVCGVLAIAGAVAAIGYLPWALYVQSQPGGYAELASYQRTLMSPDWLTNLRAQASQQLFFDGPVGRVSPLLAVLCMVLLVPQAIRTAPRFVALLVLLASAGVLLGAPATAAILAALAIPLLWQRRSAFAPWLLLSWVALWLGTTPLYQPYARLVLPLTLGIYLLAAIRLSAAFIGPWPAARVTWRPIAVAGAALGVAAVSIGVVGLGVAWQPSNGFREAARAMEPLITSGSRVVVIAEPALAFYLHLADRPAFERRDTPAALSSLQEPVYLVTGTYAAKIPEVRAWLAENADRLAVLGTFPASAGTIRVLDDFRPDQARGLRAQPTGAYDFTLYRYSPLSTAEQRRDHLDPAAGVSAGASGDG